MGGVCVTEHIVHNHWNLSSKWPIPLWALMHARTSLKSALKVEGATFNCKDMNLGLWCCWHASWDEGLSADGKIWQSVTSAEKNHAAHLAPCQDPWP